jgi:serine/threonine protein kinase
MSSTKTAAGAPSPPPIPDHQLIRRIGAGSYGEVWLARAVTGAFRAVKVVHRRSFASDRPYKREFNGILKFEPISRMHPGVMSILHVGQNLAAGCFYYVMEVADDLERGQDIAPDDYVPRTLEALLRHGPIPAADSVALALALTDSVRHLHAHGLVHRDIKPSNIIFVQDLPKLADIGLVTGVGHKGTVVGTEGYIPPEGRASASADLFSLGKVLYQMSTGMACDRFPELPKDLPGHGGIPFSLLNAVILKACEPDPDRRFQSAADLHDALLAVERGTALPPDHSSPEPVTVGQRVVILFTPDEQRDTRLACLLEERLRAERFSVFLDDRAGYGVRWARRMELEIRAADAVVLLLSDRSVQDEILTYLADLRMQAQRLAPGLMTVPVRIALSLPLSPPLEMGLAGSSALSWTGPADDDELCNEVLRVLGVALAS